MSASFDPYDVLEITRDADQATVRRAYQKLARRWHPEINPGDREAERKFAEAAQAYRLLSDPETRERFDRGQLGPRAQSAGERARRPSGWITYEEFLEVHAEWTSGEVGDERRGADLTVDLTLDLAEAVRGVTTSFSVQREVPCRSCAGGGDGGRCETCGGVGQVVELDRLRVRIPVGVGEGTRLRVAGKGNPLASGAGFGDLFVTVHLRPHPYFVRRGTDIYGDLPVSFPEAVLGADLDVPTIDGPVRVRLPAGTQGGQRFRLRGRGVELPDGRRGDHYYTVRLQVPREVDQETAEMVRKLPSDRPRRHLPTEPL